MVVNLENEFWKPVEGYFGLYEVSNFSRIKSLKRWINNRYSGFWKDEMIITPSIHSTGYECVCLSKNGVGKNLRFHRIVAKAFLPNPENKPEVNHKNGNRTDNNLNNLEWCTSSYNQKHAYEKLGKKSWIEGIDSSKVPASKKIVCDNFGMIFTSGKEAADAFGFHRSDLPKYCKGKLKHPHGLTFRYL